MTLSEAIEVQQHLINSYSLGKKINLFGEGEFMNAQYEKYVDSCTIAITLMRAAEQNQNNSSFPKSAVAAVTDNRIYEKSMKEAEAAGDKQKIRNVTALKCVADLHKISFTEMCTIINELAALQEGGNE